MEVKYTPADLIAFEEEIAALFAAKQIHAPVHLSGGNEKQLIQVFQEHVNEQDWVLCSWRSHYACLLKGVPPDQLRQAILDGKSISLCFPEHRILSSGIVGGVAPIAVGLAMGIKRKESGYIDRQNRTIAKYGLKEALLEPLKSERKVVCFLGDMTAETGIVHESIKYAIGHYLPVLFVVEDNGLSVSTITKDVWKWQASTPSELGKKNVYILRYSYKLTRPHVGIGKHVEF